MIEFIYLFLFRVLSGAQNGFGYAKNKTGRMGIGLAMALIIIASTYAALWVFNANEWRTTLSVVFLIVSAIGVVGVEDGFNDQWRILPKDIHLWELFATGGVSLAWVALGGNWIAMAASVYPALIIHKGLINLGSGKSWWYHGTDDRTGKYFTIPIFNIKIPRLSTNGRVIIAVGSIALIVLVYIYGWNFSI